MKYSFSLLAIWVLVGSLAVGQDAKMNGNLNASDEQFVREAISSGHHEVEMGQMALKQSTDPQVKSLAQRLIKDHTAAGKKLEEFLSSSIPTQSSAPSTVPATKADIQTDVNNRNDVLLTESTHPSADSGQANMARGNGMPSTSAATDHPQQMGGAMEAMRGTDFDKVWAKQMVVDHQTAIAKFETEEKEAKDANLRNFVTMTLPTLREHLSQAQALDK